MTSVKRRGRLVVVKLTADERAVVASLLGAVRTLLTGDESSSGTDDDPLAAFVGMSTGPVETPDDPVLLRLLPDAYGDPEQATEFRRLTDADLRARKTEAIDGMLDDLASGDRIELDVETGVGRWLQAVNDVRLMLGTRLDVPEDWGETVAALPPDDPRVPVYLFYNWLSALQEDLVLAVSDE